MSVIGILQIPVLTDGFYALENSSTANTAIPYQNMNEYILNNELNAVSVGWFTNKNIVVYSDGQIVPKVLLQLHPHLTFDDEYKNSMNNLETYVDVNKPNLYIVYTYSNLPDCTTESLSNYSSDHFVCAQFYLIESAAQRNEKTLSIIDFPLPDGTSYLRAFEFVD